MVLSGRLVEGFQDAEAMVVHVLLDRLARGMLRQVCLRSIFAGKRTRWPANSTG